MADPTVYDQRNGYSNRQKMIGSTYHASSLSFNKSGSKNSKQTIHSTYNGHHPSGTASGLHSHNSSIHSSHMKTRSPGNSQLSTMQANANAQGQHPPQVLVANGVTTAQVGNAPPNNLQMHHFHPSGTLHQKNSMSLGQYETTKVKVSSLFDDYSIFYLNALLFVLFMSRFAGTTWSGLERRSAKERLNLNEYEANSRESAVDVSLRRRK